MTSPTGKTYKIRERKVFGMYGINADYLAEVVARNGRVVFVGRSYQSADAALRNAIDWIVKH